MTAARPLSELLAEADHLRRSATPELDPELRGERGQLLTPSDVAALMASMFETLPEDIRLLDAGAGVGALTAALVAEACARPQRPASLSVTAYELGPVLLPSLRTTLERCLHNCAAVGTRFTQRVHPRDFIQHGHSQPSLPEMGTASKERRLLRQAGLDATNLYRQAHACPRLLEHDGHLGGEGPPAPVWRRREARQRGLVHPHSHAG